MVAGTDAIVKSKFGTGKTIAFLVRLLQLIRIFFLYLEECLIFLDAMVN